MVSLFPKHMMCSRVMVSYHLPCVTQKHIRAYDGRLINTGSERDFTQMEFVGRSVFCLTNFKDIINLQHHYQNTFKIPFLCQKIYLNVVLYHSIAINPPLLYNFELYLFIDKLITSYRFTKSVNRHMLLR